MQPRDVSIGNYDVNRYNCYRRMLSNWTVLSAEEVDEYYSRILELGERNMDVARDLERSPRPRVYYLMSKGRYAEAIPYIKRELAKPICLTGCRCCVRFVMPRGRWATGLRSLRRCRDIVLSWSCATV